MVCSDRTFGIAAKLEREARRRINSRWGFAEDAVHDEAIDNALRLERQARAGVDVERFLGKAGRYTTTHALRKIATERAHRRQLGVDAPEPRLHDCRPTADRSQQHATEPPASFASYPGLQDAIDALPVHLFDALMTVRADHPAEARRSVSARYGKCPRTIKLWLEEAILSILNRLGVPLRE